MLEPGILIEYSVTELQLAEEQVVLEKKNISCTDVILRLKTSNRKENGI